MIHFMKDSKGPVYLRTSRYAVEDVYDDYQFELGKIEQIVKGQKVAMLTTGIMVSEAKQAIEVLNNKGINPALYNVSTLKPFNKDKLNEIANNYDVIITLEEHSIIGGLYSAVVENLEEPKKVVPIGIKDTFGESGTVEALLKKYQLDKDYIVEVVKPYFGG